ncbi:hypothetical protein PENTCL1PPCAC_19240, partial [Pristionchus entomophagus]
SFNMRAQKLVMDIWCVLKDSTHHDLVQFFDLSSISALADHKLAQVLNECGCIQYSDKLKVRINNKEKLPSDDPDEVEIRACSIAAVKRIYDEVRYLEEKSDNHKKTFGWWKMIYPIHIDFWLRYVREELERRGKNCPPGLSRAHRSDSQKY